MLYPTCWLHANRNQPYILAHVLRLKTHKSNLHFLETNSLSNTEVTAIDFYLWIYGLLRHERQTTISQSACADATHHSFDTVHNHFLLNSCPLKGPGWLYTSEKETCWWISQTHRCGHTSVGPHISGWSILSQSDVLTDHIGHDGSFTKGNQGMDDGQ